MGKLITIDKRFEKSVNLFFDIGNKEKIGSYIETYSSKEIINQYFESLKPGNRERVSMLIGPYGKGKSHLLLVLIDRLEHLDKPFLPVIISYGQQDLKKEFILGLQKALNRAGIKDIYPDSYHTEAVRQILMWKRNYKDTYKALEKILREKNISTDKFTEDLGRYSEKSLKIFREIYPKLTSGGIFEPLIQTDLKGNFISINKQLAEKYGYGGIFVVFDEFGKYIEGHNLKGYENDMKVLQDMCELAVKSDEPQFHLTMVTHKGIKEYGNTVDKRIMDGFMGIEGRIKEIYYIDSVQSHYELISSVLKKDKRLFKSEVAENEMSGYRHIVSESYKHPYFKALFSYEEFETIVGMGCFPLTPVAAYLLLNISWKIAQNERTLFTFLAGGDINGLGNLIRINGEKTYFGGEVVYDYFENVFREEVNNENVHSEWLKADYAINNTDNEEEIKFIKNLALIHMLHKENEMPATDLNVALSMGIDSKKCEEIRDNLIKSNLIVYRKKRRLCRLKNSIGVDVEEEINRIKVDIASGTDMVSYLNKISCMKYELPKRYNFQYKMTRFFQYEFFYGKEFTGLNTFKYLFDEKFSDGKIILLLNHVEDSEIDNVLNSIRDRRIVVINPASDFSGKDLLERYAAIELLENDEEFINNNRVVLPELELYRQEIYFDINDILESNYLIENGNCKVYSLTATDGVKDSQDFNRLLSSICDKYYQAAPKINHELINRNHISSQTRKARANLISGILGHQDMDIYLKGTSAEATIYRAAVVRAGGDAGTMEMQEIIKEFVYGSAGKKRSFDILYGKLQGKDFGIRKGIIPLYLARVLSELNDMPVIYCLDKEVVISSEILENVEECPEDYSLYLEKATVEKEEYLSSLKKLFNVGDSDDILNSIIGGMLNWYRALPQYSSSYRNGLTKTQIRFRQTLRGQDKNAGELLFKVFPQIFETGDFREVFINIKDIKRLLDTHMDRVYQEYGTMVRRAFGGSAGDDIHNLIKKWKRENNQYLKNHVCSVKLSGLAEFAEHMEGYEDSAILGDLSKILIDIFPENWSDTSQDTLEKQLISVLNEVSESNEESGGLGKVRFTASDGNIIEKSYDRLEEDGTGVFLQNAIEEALEEFDDVIDNKQKVAVLINTLERVIKNG